MNPVTISIEHLPEVLWRIRQEMANVIRRQAERELSVYCAGRLREIALIFETGQSS